jgi:hypothetical protein
MMVKYRPRRPQRVQAHESVPLTSENDVMLQIERVLGRSRTRQRICLNGCGNKAYAMPRMLKPGRESADGYPGSVLGSAAGPEARSSALTANTRQNGRSAGCEYIAEARAG